jgi:pimeloyl-ACP methyl ester carboxylesterase
MELKTITYQSSTIFYRSIGTGKPVVFIHGFGEDGDIWQTQIDFLKERCQLIIPDLPGSGQSEMIEDMSMEGMADVIKAILDNELQEAEEVFLFGHSMGGYITLAFVEKYPSLLAAFGLIHSSAFADNEEKKNTRAKAITFIEKNGAYDFLKTSIPDLFLKGQEGTASSDPFITELIEKGKNFSPEALIAYYRAMINRPDRIQVLRSFPGPVLFIIGQHDKAIPLQQSLQQCYLPEQPHVHILRLSAHMGMIEESDKANDALLGFL